MKQSDFSKIEELLLKRECKWKEIDFSMFKKYNNGFKYKSGEVSRKWKEEAEEAYDAIMCYMDNLSDPNTKSLREGAISELSDFIVANGKAIIRGDISFEKDTMPLISRIIRLNEEYKKKTKIDFLASVTSDELHKKHIEKSEEIYQAFVIYDDILAGKKNKWSDVIYRLRTIEEVKDPKNKLPIMKEIRRVLYYTKYM